MSTSIPSSAVTDGQKTKYLRLVEDAAKRAARLALEKVETDKDGMQRLLGRGDELEAAIAEVVIARTREFTVSDQFANEEVPSNYGYLSGYRMPVSIADQIDILRSHWPNLNPDRALRYAAEIYPTLQLPRWIEGPFALIRPDFFSNIYGEELKEVLRALKKDRKGKFHNYREGQLGPNQLRQSERTLLKLRAFMEQQPDSDILVVPSQFGIRHRGRSVRRARKVFVNGEFGHGVKDTGTMILTNPVRLQHYDDLWIDCAGDEFSPDADGRFGRAPFFRFSGGKVEFASLPVGDAGGYYGSASGLLPQ